MNPPQGNIVNSVTNIKKKFDQQVRHDREMRQAFRTGTN